MEKPPRGNQSAYGGFPDVWEKFNRINPAATKKELSYFFLAPFETDATRIRTRNAPKISFCIPGERLAAFRKVVMKDIIRAPKQTPSTLDFPPAAAVPPTGTRRR